MNNTTYYQRNREIMLNRLKDYYEKWLREHAKDKYRNLPEEEKIKKREYGKNTYHNMSEENKEKLKKYQRIYIKKIIVKQKKLFHILVK